MAQAGERGTGAKQEDEERGVGEQLSMPSVRTRLMDIDCMYRLAFHIGIHYFAELWSVTVAYMF